MLLTLLETLRWRAIWRSRNALSVETNRELGGAARKAGGVKQAFVWLSGIGDYGDSAILPEERAFVERLAERCPHSVVIAGHLPSDVTTDARYRQGDIWRKVGRKRPPLWTWAAHNFWQFVLASVCERAYGRDMAQVLAQRLQAEFVPPGCPLLLICGSAGAQIALACAPFLRAQGYETLYVIALGGEFGSPRGLEAVARLAQFVGERDGWGRLGGLFPGRWMPGSRCAQLRNAGRLTIHSSGPHGHFGAYSYLDNNHPTPEGMTYADVTLNRIVALPWWEEWAAKTE